MIWKKPIRTGKTAEKSRKTRDAPGAPGFFCISQNFATERSCLHYGRTPHDETTNRLSDGFLKLDDPSQLLYYQLMLEADDDGFIANPLTLVRMVDSRKEHLETLVEHGYLIQFPSGWCW